MKMKLSRRVLENMRIPYGVRHVPQSAFQTLLPVPTNPLAGDIALARLEKLGKNTKLELTTGRQAALHEGDLLVVVFGNRYATEQFEGYARIKGDSCDLLSMGGLCGLVQSKHASVAEPSKLRILGLLGDSGWEVLRLRDFALPPASSSTRPNVVVVCGTSMDAGKTHTAMSVIKGLRSIGQRVAGIKLTGTAAGRDTWCMHDAGADPALDFGDVGLPSTYLAPVEQLLKVYEQLLARAGSMGAEWAVIEIADGVLQMETAALLKCAAFTRTVDHWVLATSDPLAADGGIRVLRSLGIEPIAISGVISMSPLAVLEAESATGIRCLCASDLQRGALNPFLQAQPSTTNDGYQGESEPAGASLVVAAAS